jgi:hypothetical protein
VKYIIPQLMTERRIISDNLILMVYGITVYWTSHNVIYASSIQNCDGIFQTATREWLVLDSSVESMYKIKMCGSLDYVEYKGSLHECSNNTLGRVVAETSDLEWSASGGHLELTPNKGFKLYNDTKTNITTAIFISE